MRISNLKETVLRELSKARLSGYSLIKRINETSGWNPSPGSVYPLLKEFLEDGLVDVKEEGRKKIYSITAKGSEMLDMLEKHSRFKWLTDDMMLLRKTCLDIVEEDLGNKEMDRIKGILRDSVQRMRLRK